MIIAVLLILGLCLGSFVNALVWRLHEQEKLSGKADKASIKKRKSLSIVKGRSMCPNCKHELAATDLVPVISWLLLRGKCGYCHKSISWHYPAVELLVPALFIFSYIFWPIAIHGYGLLAFCVWLVMILGFVALTVYDLRWFMLPDKIVWPLAVLALLQVLMHIVLFGGGLHALYQAAGSVVIASGFFGVLFIVSRGHWIGGGDVKLGLVIGLILGAWQFSLSMLFLASAIGTIVSLPLLITKKLRRTSVIPFGPFLIAGTIIVELFGHGIVNWFNTIFVR